MTVRDDGGVSILIVEDEQLIALDLKETLEELGHTIVGMAADSAEAFRKAKELEPDFCFMDIGLKGDQDGIATAGRIHEQLGIPVIYLTGANDAQTINRAAQSRPFGYLLKPFDEAAIRGAIEVAIARHRAEAELLHREKALATYAEALRTQSLVDELTGLYNRRAFLTLARHQLKAMGRNHRPCVLLFIDLNGLKKINDSHGHAAGDHLLKDMAVVLTHTFRQSDIVSRLGGDEFVVLAVESEETGSESALIRLQAAIREHNAAEPMYPISISVGTAVPNPDHPEALEELLAQADAAMYKEKRTAKAG